MYVCVYVCLYVFMYVSMYVCMCMCVCMFVCTCVHVYVVCVSLCRHTTIKQAYTGTAGRRRYIFNPFINSVLEGIRVVNTTSRALYPRKRSSIPCTWKRVGLKACLEGHGISSLRQVSTSGPTSFYQLRYPGLLYVRHCTKNVKRENCVHWLFLCVIAKCLRYHSI